MATSINKLIISYPRSRAFHLELYHRHMMSVEFWPVKIDEFEGFPPAELTQLLLGDAKSSKYGSIEIGSSEHGIGGDTGERHGECTASLPEASPDLVRALVHGRNNYHGDGEIRVKYVIQMELSNANAIAPGVSEDLLYGSCMRPAMKAHLEKDLVEGGKGAPEETKSSAMMGPDVI